MLDQAFEALKSYQWGVDPKALRPISDAINATHGDAAAREALEKRLSEVLGSDAPRAAKDAVCRSLRTIGTAASVPALAALLPDAELSHMARYALQAIPAPQAAEALAAALPKVPAEIKIGIASSLGARGAGVPTAPLGVLLADKDPAVARAGALALGALGSHEAAGVLASATADDAATRAAVADGLLGCAENLRAAGKEAEAKAIYGKILASNPSEPIKTAATLGAAR